MTGALTLCTLLAVGQAGNATPATTADIDRLAAESRKTLKSCGPVSVWYCLRRLGHPVRVEDVLAAGGDERGVQLRGLVSLAERFGARARLLSGDKANLASLPVPCILVIESNHCVVYEGLADEGRSVTVFEPYSGRTVTAPVAELEPVWTGEVVTFTDLPLSRVGFASTVVLTSLGVLAIAVPARAAGRRVLRGSPRPTSS